MVIQAWSTVVDHGRPCIVKWPAMVDHGLINSMANHGDPGPGPWLTMVDHGQRPWSKTMVDHGQRPWLTMVKGLKTTGKEQKSQNLNASCFYFMTWNAYRYMSIINDRHTVMKKSKRKAMNRNWSNQKANPALKTKAGNK